MRDIIWTLIIIWLIYKVVEIFRSASTKRSAVNNAQGPGATDIHQSTPKRDIKKALKKHLNNEGEYVDFEEIK